MLRIFVSIAVVLACLGCAAPAFTTRTVQSEPSWFVGLTSYAEPAKAAAVRHDHPAEWTEKELHQILDRLLLQERVGLLDPLPPPRAVFSPEATAQLVPALRGAFHSARPSEWIVFFFARPSGADQEITSGGLFLMDSRLHVIVANYRERVSPGSAETDAIRANPLRSYRGTGGSLAFDPPRFVLASQANWLGGSSGPSASELVLDHTAFLATATAPGAPLTSVGARASDEDFAKLRGQVDRLQEEVARLREQLAAQADELARLKSRQTHGDSAQPSQPRKPLR